MTSKALRLPLLMALAASAELAPQAASAGNPTVHVVDVDCSRQCYHDLLTQVLDAMAANDVSDLPLSPDAKVTENGVRMNVYDGLWQTATRVGKYRLEAIDTQAGQIGAFVTVVEGTNPVLISIRLRVKEQKIAEVETIVARGSGGSQFPPPGKTLEEKGHPRPQFDRTVPESERMSRADLARIGESYFSWLQGSTGKGSAPFTDTCNRWENGFQTTNGKSPNAGASGGTDIVGMGCRDQQLSGFFPFVTSIRNRRMEVVDPVKGIAIGYGYFDHTGTVQQMTLSDGSVAPAPFLSPLTFQIAEAFEIDKGKIDQIEAVLNTVPYRMKSDYWDRSAD